LDDRIDGIRLNVSHEIPNTVLPWVNQKILFHQWSENRMNTTEGMSENEEIIDVGGDPCGCDCCGDDGFSRREMLGLGAAAAAAGGLGLPSGALAEDGPLNMPVQPGDRFMVTRGKLKKTLLTADLLQPGARPLEGFPVTPDTHEARDVYRNNRVLMLKLDESKLDPATKERTAGGILVYSAICTHKGCTIKSWMKKEQYLRCHCHLSVFDPSSKGNVKSGPAKRQLPAVPLEVDAEGYVVARDGWTSTPGASKT
jgi:rieske iron-sulfur protein